MKLLSKRQQTTSLIGWLAITFGVAALGAVASAGASAFYAQLTQPDWAPPGWVFGPVWTVLYALMGISAWLVWRRGGWADNRLALGMFLIHLLPNALWSWLFFAWRLGPWAFADILLLLALIGMTIALFWRVSAFAAALLVPYLVWVAFAAVLNYSVWQLNPQILGLHPV